MCEAHFTLREMKRYNTSLVCPSCVSIVGALGTEVLPGTYTFSYIHGVHDSAPHTFWVADEERDELFKNLEEIDPVRYYVDLQNNRVEKLEDEQRPR